MSENRSNKNAWNKGKTGIYTEEVLQKIKRSKNWIVISPEGDEFHINDLSLFCKQKNINKHSMYRLAKGQIKKYNNWKCYLSE